jgi:hypothetical protein
VLGAHGHEAAEERGAPSHGKSSFRDERLGDATRGG